MNDSPSQNPSSSTEVTLDFIHSTLRIIEYGSDSDIKSYDELHSVYNQDPKLECIDKFDISPPEKIKLKQKIVAALKNDYEDRLVVLISSGFQLMKKGEYDLAIKKYEKLIKYKIIEEMDLKSFGDIHFNIGNCYFMRKRFKEAQPHFTLTKEIYEKCPIKNKEEIEKINNLIEQNGYFICGENVGYGMLSWYYPEQDDNAEDNSHSSENTSVKTLAPSSARKKRKKSESQKLTKTEQEEKKRKEKLDKEFIVEDDEVEYDDIENHRLDQQAYKKRKLNPKKSSKKETKNKQSIISEEASQKTLLQPFIPETVKASTSSITIWPKSVSTTSVDSVVQDTQLSEYEKLPSPNQDTSTEDENCTPVSVDHLKTSSQFFSPSINTAETNSQKTILDNDPTVVKKPFSNAPAVTNSVLPQSQQQAGGNSLGAFFIKNPVLDSSTQTWLTQPQYLSRFFLSDSTFKNVSQCINLGINGAVMKNRQDSEHWCKQAEQHLNRACLSAMSIAQQYNNVNYFDVMIGQLHGDIKQLTQDLSALDNNLNATLAIIHKSCQLSYLLAKKNDRVNSEAYSKYAIDSLKKLCESVCVKALPQAVLAQKN